MWFFVVIMMFRAVAQKHILWPQKQEDRDEGGWTTETEAILDQRIGAEVRARMGSLGRVEIDPGIISRSQ